MKTSCILCREHQILTWGLSSYSITCNVSSLLLLLIMLLRISWTKYANKETSNAECAFWCFYLQLPDLCFLFHQNKQTKTDFRVKTLFFPMNVWSDKSSNSSLLTTWPHMATAWLCILTDLDTLQNERTWLKAARMKSCFWSGFNSKCNWKSTVCRHVDAASANRCPQMLFRWRWLGRDVATHIDWATLTWTEFSSEKLALMFCFCCSYPHRYHKYTVEMLCKPLILS